MCSVRRISSVALLSLVFGFGAVSATAQSGVDPYVPPAWGTGEWQRRSPEDAGFDPELLAAAVAFAEERFARDGGFDPSREPYGETVGPTKPPSGMNGLVLHEGYLVTEWGDTQEVDMTFSITKTYLSTVAGLAFDAGKIRDLDEPVRRSVQDGSFDTVHNRPITWHQLLNQTSGWEGTLWGKPDWADRYRPRQGRRPSAEPAAAGSTTTCGSTCSRSPCSISGANPCPGCCGNG